MSSRHLSRLFVSGGRRSTGSSTGKATIAGLGRYRRLIDAIFRQYFRWRTLKPIPCWPSYPELFSTEVALIEVLVTVSTERSVLSIRPFFVWFSAYRKTIVTVVTGDPSTIHARPIKHFHGAARHDFQRDFLGPSWCRRRRRGTRRQGSATHRSLLLIASLCNCRSYPRPHSFSRSFPRPLCFLLVFIVRFCTGEGHRRSRGANRQGKRKKGGATHCRGTGKRLRGVWEDKPHHSRQMFPSIFFRKPFGHHVRNLLLGVNVPDVYVRVTENFKTPID